MANNYLQFALTLPLKSSAEHDWCKKTMSALVELIEYGDGEDPESKLQLAKELGALGHVVMSEGWDFVGFEFSVSPNSMSIVAEESGSPEQVASFLQQYLETFHPQGSLWFSWATTCSKMRSGEFGGGAAFVTAKSIKFIDAASWAEEQAEKLVA